MSAEFDLKITTTKGDLNYRLPDILEGYDFLVLVDLANGGDVYKIKGKLMKEIGTIVDYKSVGHDTWESALKDRALREAVIKINNDVFEDIMELIRKKA